MSIDEILEMLDDALEKAKQVPFSGKKSLIDTEKFQELVDEIRLSLPNEIKQAKRLVQDRKTIINDAKGEADAIIKKAEEKAVQMTNQQEITRLAQQRAQEIMTEAQNRSKGLRNSANEYVEKLLSETEELLTHDLADIKRVKASLKARK